MKLSFLSLAVFATCALGLSPYQSRKLKANAARAAALNARQPPSQGPSFKQTQHQNSRRANIIPKNANTTKFAVDGKAIPDVDFDIGESYAGLLPISNASDASELYFWFFPSSNPNATDEILIWLNGGPGCSSLEGLLQENGPFLWQYGTFKPVENPWTWVKLTNVLWVEQPAGTGFSKKNGSPVAQSEEDVAKQFLGFFKNFVDTFALQGKKVYIAGESYAGAYVPYIADAMHTARNRDYYNIESIMIYDPVLTYDVIGNDIPTAAFVDYWGPLLSLNKTFVDHLHARSKACGYDAYMNMAMTYPPAGPFPDPPNRYGQANDCSLWYDVVLAATLVNPCFDRYQVATTCPLLWDVLGFPGSFDYLPEGASIYFNRPEVQKAINAPVGQWQECSDGVLDTDTSPPSGLSVLPRVIEKNRRTIIAHGDLDFELLRNGSLMAVQNMTFRGKQGFSVPPEKWQTFYVPYHEDGDLGTIAGSGDFGKWHSERGLTFCTVGLSGHMVPQYAPSAAYRQLEFLLGRVVNLSAKQAFSAYP